MEQVYQRLGYTIHEALKPMLDGSLRNFIKWKVSLLIVRELELDNLFPMIKNIRRNQNKLF